MTAVLLNIPWEILRGSVQGNDSNSFPKPLGCVCLGERVDFHFVIVDAFLLYSDKW